MLKPLIPLFYLLIIISPLQAQFEETYRGYGEFNAGEKVLLFGDQVNLRDQASTAGQVVSQLPIGQLLTVQEIGPNASINGLNLPWLQVATEYNGQALSGWLWSGLVSQLARKGSGGELFLLGAKSYKANRVLVEVRVLQAGRLQDQIEFPAIGDLGHFLELNLFDNRGIAGIQQVLQPTFSYEACGYANGEVTLLWDGNKIHLMGTTANWSEAGVGYMNETYHFPDDEVGMPGRILWVKEDAEIDEVGNGQMVQTSIAWRWDGEKLVKYTY